MKKTMLDYVKETPEVVVDNVNRSEALTAAVVDEFLSGDYKSILIIGSGSSYTSALIASEYMKDALGISVTVMNPATFTYYNSKLDSSVFVLVISQSGYSTNAILALEMIKKQNLKAVGITSDVNSKFKDVADIVVDYGGGIENTALVTKGVITITTFLILFALEAALKSNLISDKKAEEDKENIVSIMNQYDDIILSTKKFVDKNFKYLSNWGVVYVAGIGANYGVAKEIALKIGETNHVPSISLELEELVHGPELQLSPEYTIIILDNGDHSQDLAVELYEATKIVTDKTFLITNSYESSDSRVFKTYNCHNQLLNPLAYLPVLQLMAFYVMDELNVTRHPLSRKFFESVNAKAVGFELSDDKIK